MKAMICRSKDAWTFVGVIFLITIGLISCSSDYSPKPAGYFYITLPEHQYRTETDYPDFRMAVSTQAQIEDVSGREKGMWLNIHYPAFNAQIYCEYLPVTRESFREAAEDARKLAYLHTLKADAIRTKTFENPEEKVYGLIYFIHGNVASPTQFVLTDSVHSFFRGALYFNHTPNQDSITPVLDYLNEDIRRLIESFQWKS
jgi:gliding motility-associated lipoprotein GldD